MKLPSAVTTVTTVPAVPAVTAVTAANGSKPSKVVFPGTWETRLICCCDTYECGLTCCCQHTWCQPCIVASAMGWTDCSESASTLTCFALSCCQGTCIGIAAAYLVRRNIVVKYNISESACCSCLTACCCLYCSNIQVAGKVARQENLTYGCTRLTPPLVGVVRVETMER